MESNLRIYYEVLLDGSKNDKQDRSAYRLQLSGFVMACQFIDSDDARQIVKEYEELSRSELDCYKK